jgi:hypothetical protein
MSIKLKFTKKLVQGLSAPTGKPRQIYVDRDAPSAKIRKAVPRLQLNVFRTGNRSFVLCRKFQGNTRFITLGKYPDLSVEMAKDEARAHIANMRNGIDPGRNKKAVLRKQIPLSEVFKDYLKVRKNHLSENTVSNYHTVIRSHLSNWKNKELRGISRNMVQQRHAQLSETSPTSANKAMRVLRALFNFANGQYENEEGKGLFPDNPVSRLSHVRIWNKESRGQNKIDNADLKPFSG